MLMVLDRGHSLDSSGVEGHTVSRNNETIVFTLLFLLVLEGKIQQLRPHPPASEGCRLQPWDAASSAP